MQGRTSKSRALKKSWWSFNWVCAAGCAGMGLEPTSGCESSKRTSLASNSAMGVVGSLGPLFLPVPQLHGCSSTHPWLCSNKATAIQIQPARKCWKLAGLVKPHTKHCSQWRLKRTRMVQKMLGKQKGGGGEADHQTQKRLLKFGGRCFVDSEKFSESDVFYLPIEGVSCGFSTAMTSSER